MGTGKQRGQKIADGALCLERMTQRNIERESIVIASSFAAAAQHPCRFELDDDPVHGSLGDADQPCDVSEGRIRIAREADEDVGVVAQERPAGTFALGIA